MFTEPQKEHGWLKQLLGEWTSEADCGPGGKMPGTEIVSQVGDLWVMCEGRATMPDGKSMHTFMTLGYDPATNRFVGTWIGSIGAHLWIYDGTLDASEKILTLDSEGPDFSKPGKTAKYKDTIEIKSADYRTLSSATPGEDGVWHTFMTTHYHRKK